MRRTERRGWLLIAFLAFLPFLTLIPASNGVSSSKTVTGKLLRASDTQGWIAIPSIVATGISHDANLFYFTGLSTGFPTLGFSVSATGNITSLTLGTDTLMIGVSSTLLTTTEVYLPTKLEPTTTTGIISGSWSGITRIYTFTTMGAVSAVLSWVTAPPTDPVTALLETGNIFGAIGTFYSLRYGMVFPGLIAFVVSAVLYIRGQDPLYAIAAWLLIGGTLASFLPGDLINVARVLTVVGISVLIIKVFMGRNSDSG